MPRFLLAICLMAAASALAAPEPATELAARNAAAWTPADLETLLRLQLAAGDFAKGEATVARLQRLYSPIQPQRAAALVPWTVYARAKRREAAGSPAPEALALAFGETVGPLSDAELARALPWYAANWDRLRAGQDRAAARCERQPVDSCPEAAGLLAARQSLATWTYLMPASQPLLRAELERRFTIDDRLLVRTSDGADIATLMVRPRRPAGKLTALLAFTIYANDDNALADAVQMAAHGYAGVVAYSRGKGRSAGRPVPYEHDGADAAQVIDWLAAQTWSDGRVGMFSGSYNASTQWGAAKRHPKALRALATSASNAPGIDTPMQGGVFQSFIYPWPLYTTATPWLDEVNYGDSARWARLNRNWYVSGRPYRELPLIDGQPNPIFSAWLSHPTYDAYWQRFIPVGAEFARIDIPVFVEAGYFDGGMVGALHYFREHVGHRPEADHRMLVGPYHHFAMSQGVLANVGGYDVDRAALIDLQAVRLQWFDHVFRGAPLPALLSAKINFEVMGENRWAHADTIDAMAPRRRRLYLDGAKEGDRLRLGDAPPAAARAPVLTVDLGDRSDADLVVPDRQLDTRGALVFATPRLPRPLLIAGAFRGRFTIVTNKRDVDLAVGLFEERADGLLIPLSSYLGRASQMADRTRRRLLAPGRPQTLTFESQTITAARLAAGSRLVALVGVPKQPEIEINYGSGKPVAEESAADAGPPLRIRWLPGSHLELGVGDD